MTSITSAKLTARLFILAVLSLSLWFFSGKAVSTSQESKEIAVDIIKQLEPVGGVVPVEIYCGPARLSAPNQVEALDCKLKNNTGKNITAANVIYSVVLAENGAVNRDSHNSFLEALVHPDFKDSNRLIGPGEERSVGPAGQLSYPSAVIKTVEIGIDYVEFDDDTTLGVDQEGSRITKGIRAGAAKYKGWLSKKYAQSGESDDVVVTLLEQESPLTDEIDALDQYQEIGAKAYRNSLRKAYRSRGKSEVKRLLKNSK